MNAVKKPNPGIIFFLSSKCGCSAGIGATTGLDCLTAFKL